ncbi:succinylarginine dihydrolase [Breoghania corrubedonensis]|uniref:Succinylarginine dihydrolase n=1 Tax=Breoghania corrubedonensis TaxID=665038 RepID=A0A2T5VG71_9HYPH|nr:DUF1839 family protein [Breoghania corrubedonensis]PTW62728.1 succinylarginine dihydrolase [Breoghania corrubedonensis]
MTTNTEREAVFPALDPAAYPRHALHSMERDWPETNCYLDIWIEVLATLGLPPQACLGFAVTQDFEGDQFTFFKTPLEDLESLFGIRVTELAIYDLVERHVTEQIARGRLTLVEMDSYYLPDTQGTAYHKEHGKTTVAINRLDIGNRTMDYFHNLGLHRLEGEDFDGIFQRKAEPDAAPFLPYTEFVKFPAEFPDQRQVVSGARELLRRHLERRPQANPIAAFGEVFAGQVASVSARPFGFFHLYAFNTLRQLGANFELFSSHLEWLAGNAHEGLDAAIEDARQISATAKIVQFQLARSVMRKKFDKLAPALQPAAEAWDRLIERLERASRQTKIRAA